MGGTLRLEGAVRRRVRLSLALLTLPAAVPALAAHEPKPRGSYSLLGPILCVAFSADGKTFAASSFNPLAQFDVHGVVANWDTGTGEERNRFFVENDVFSLALTPDGKAAFLGGKKDDKGELVLRDLESEKELLRLEGHSEAIYSVALAPDGKTLASASMSQVKVWDAASGKERFSFRLDPKRELATRVALTSNGKLLASGGPADTVKLWDVTTGKERATLKGHTGAVLPVCFSPDGKTLASGGKDKTVRLWDAAVGVERKALSGHTGTIFALAFSSDGKVLASGSGDKTVKLWDVSTGKELATLKGHRGAVVSVAFMPGRDRLATGSMDCTVQVWDVAQALKLNTSTHRGK